MADSAKKIRTVAVYCGSNEGKSPVFAEKAAGKPFIHNQLVSIFHNDRLDVLFAHRARRLPGC